MTRVLVTGGAGFIGSHVARELLASDRSVRALDVLDDQVHSKPGRPSYLDPEVELVIGDVCDREVVQRALQDVDHVVHLAARVGVGQSMYEMADYAAANTVGTAVLLDALQEHPVESLVVASSMSIYGEGLYRSGHGELRHDVSRSRDQLQRHEWEPLDHDGQPLAPIPTPESKAPALSSVYALTKYDQERLCLMFGESYGISTTALRFFNVYGRDQALSNPYTGVLAIFASRLLNGAPPLIFEDGEQRRDFVSVHDVARACRLALEKDQAAGHAVNIGSGRSSTVTEIAEKLGKVLDAQEIEPQVTGKYRVGDVRHCFADISLAKELLGFEPEVELEEGIAELAEWLEGQVASDQVETASDELASRGLTF